MKTTIAKIGLLGIAGAIAFALCSFKTTMPPIKTAVSTTDEDEWAEWTKVHDFVDEKICNVIIENEKSKGHDIQIHNFSRCPSGYESNIASKQEDVKVDKFVFGKINFYKGCSPKYICDFKVCVAKGTALVKTKDMNEYVPVAEWLGKKDTKGTLVKG
ncbi:MAG TPA: hypothetical protein VN026_07070 [Bacteroidia bacterium]|jgi:hypothetical protein|nr:hypothetical protein [Bacteroidia bacterium]